MPESEKAKEVMQSMKETYDSEEKAEEVYHATANKENRDPDTWKKKGSVFFREIGRKIASASR